MFPGVPGDPRKGGFRGGPGTPSRRGSGGVFPGVPGGTPGVPPKPPIPGVPGGTPRRGVSGVPRGTHPGTPGYPTRVPTPGGYPEWVPRVPRGGWGTLINFTRALARLIGVASSNLRSCYELQLSGCAKL